MNVLKLNIHRYIFHNLYYLNYSIDIHEYKLNLCSHLADKN